jgi:hypothetical protein
MSNAGPSTSTSSNVQNSVQGGQGTTVGEVSGSNDIINDPSLQLATVQALSDTVNNALAGGATLIGNTIQGAQQQYNAQSASDSQILANALESEASTSAYQGTGGASLVQPIIYAVLAVVGLVVVVFAWKESEA